MGEVYEARDLVLQATVAVKTLPAELAGDAAALDRLRREVLLARRVAHPNVCRIHELHQDLEDDDGLAFISMEFLEGETLGQRLKRSGAIPASEALGLLEQLGEGLGAIHREGLVHRDFKPGNVMLVRATEGQRAVVMDFGIARPLSPEDGSGPTVTASVGTPRYMAPEQVRGGELGPRTDVYAFALVAQEMVTGAPPGVDGTEVRLPAGWAPPIRRATRTLPSRRFDRPVDVARALRRGRRPVVLAASAALLLLAATGAALWVAPRTVHLISRRPAPIPTSSSRLAVVPVDDSSASAAVAEALRTELSLPGAVRANSEEDIWPALRASPPTDVASPSAELFDELRRTAASEWALLTSATATGSELRVRLVLHRTAGDRPPVSTELTGSVAAFPETAARAGSWARAALSLAPLATDVASRMRGAHAPTLETAAALAGAGTQLRLGRPSAALPLIEQVTQTMPGLAPALDLQARILSEMGRFRAAKPVLARAAEAARALPELLRLRIERRYWQSLGNEDEMRPVTEKLRVLAPDDPSIALTNLNLGKTVAERREKLQALRTARSPITLSPLFDETEAVVALLAGDPATALAAIERGEQKLRGFEDRLRRLERFGWLRNNALKQLGRLDEALAANRSATEVYRAEKEGYRVAYALLFSAENLHDFRQWAAAVKLLDQSRAAWVESKADFEADDDIMLAKHVADDLMHLGRADDAARELEATTSRHPQECSETAYFVEMSLQVAIARGRIADAQTFVGTLDALGEQGRRSLGRVWLALELDDLPAAERLHAIEEPARGGFGKPMQAGHDVEEVALAEARLEANPKGSAGDVPLPAIKTDSPGVHSALLRLESKLALARGDLPLALAKANESLAQALRFPDGDVEWDARKQIARVRFAQGEPIAAEQELRPLAALAAAGGYRYLALEVELVRLHRPQTPAARRKAAQRLEREASGLGFRRIARLAREAGSA
jgi:serine/threonine protein kinase/tetratricopeptide (TPR) repeat protein